MVDVRTLLAAVLGVALGLVFVAAPDLIVRVHTTGRRPQDRRGEYGGDPEITDRWRRVVQAVGVGSILAGLYFGSTIL